MGDVNHSDEFCKRVGRTMAKHLTLCNALQHWATLPALKIPSDYARILDGYTCLGEPCQILIHVVTLPSGTIDWILVDIVPNAAYPEVVKPGAQKGGVQKFKQAGPAAQLIRAAELQRLSMIDKERLRRHAGGGLL